MGGAFAYIRVLFFPILFHIDNVSYFFFPFFMFKTSVVFFVLDEGALNAGWSYDGVFHFFPESSLIGIVVLR